MEFILVFINSNSFSFQNTPSIKDNDDMEKVAKKLNKSAKLMQALYAAFVLFIHLHKQLTRGRQIHSENNRPCSKFSSMTHSLYLYSSYPFCMVINQLEYISFIIP